MNVQIAVAVGYYFAIVDSKDVKGIPLKQAGQVVCVNDECFPLYKGETFADSQRIDAIMDEGHYTIRSIQDYVQKNTAKEYDVTITRYGCAVVTANSRQEAIKIANSLREEDISWTDDWTISDAVEQ